MFKIAEVRVVQGYRLWLRYTDGTEGEVDLSDLAGRGVFAAWNERRFFETVQIDDSGALVWGDQLDLCPDALYLRLTGKPAEDVFPKLKTNRVHA
ncbi:MAG: DUF2442 domain-containing protein [Acidobacteria bacterium]|nr:DUF2442 domain-containing protein [Acidobacteriota bacterium]